MLLLTPVLWGATFPAAKLGLDAIGVLPFMAWTRVLGFLTILVAIPFLSRRQVTAAAVRRVLWPGLLLGALIFVAYLLQTEGLARTTATNAGFITGLYVVFTPLLAMAFLRRRVGASLWVAVAISVVGVTLLSLATLGDVRFRFGDLLVLAATLVWAAQVVAIERFAPRHPALLLSLAQMGAAALFHLVAATPGGLHAKGAAEIWPLLLITGILGSGVAYTLQVVAQQRITSTRAVVILAGESVSAAAISFVWLGERLLPHQWLGAALVLAAMVVSELGARREDLAAEAAIPI